MCHGFMKCILDSFIILFIQCYFLKFTKPTNYVKLLVTDRFLICNHVLSTLVVRVDNFPTRSIMNRISVSR